MELVLAGDNDGVSPTLPGAKTFRFPDRNEKYMDKTSQKGTLSANQTDRCSEGECIKLGTNPDIVHSQGK